ncbi:MAG: hypothetical protein HY673_07160 [Chloroflexi bacterium]|nr:hypothetical protein [Chloroflexota bacterium]
MKIAEVRDVIQKHSRDELRVIITRLYKAMPKAIKEKNDIDGLLRDPNSSVQSGRGSKQEEPPDIDWLEYEANEFIEDAYKQYYFAPNSFVPKSERPKWRFIVKRLYKDLLLAADKENVSQAAAILEKLYNLLCYSCSYILFSGDDPFGSVGIAQEEFFRKVLSLKYQCEDKATFIRNALLSMVNNASDRHTLRDNLMAVILEFARTPDLKEMTIARCSELIDVIKREQPSKKQAFGSTYEYEKEEKLNNLAGMGFFCYARLCDYDNAISYFKANYGGTSSQVLVGSRRPGPCGFALRAVDCQDGNELCGRHHERRPIQNADEARFPASAQRCFYRFRGERRLSR